MRGPAAPKIAVIGGGVAGLSCARRLAEGGCAVSVFDKGRKPGGRVATRRLAGHAFDHGAQYFTATDTRFRRIVEAGRRAGLVAPWNDREVRLPPIEGAGEAHGGGTRSAVARWVAVPGMSALAGCLRGDFAVHCGVRIETIGRHAGRHNGSWHLTAADGTRAGPFDSVVVAVPAPQAQPLLTASPTLARRAAAATMAPCWALMLGFAAPNAVSAPAVASSVGGPLAWICNDSAKPGRAGSGASASWVAHASAEWSRAHLEDDAADAARSLFAAFSASVGGGVPQPSHLAAHRWRFARVETAIGEPFLFDAARSLGACGDWCLGARIEAAFLSGHLLAQHILAPT